MSKIILKIRKDGTVEAETNGITGKKCDDYTKIIEEITDSKVINKQYTEEYYQEDDTTTLIDEKEYN